MIDLLITIIGIIALILCWVMLYDSNRFVVRKYSVQDGRIKRQCRAVVLSDLHNKQYGRNNEKLLEAIRESKPDFILIAGDILTANRKESPKPALALLRELSKAYPVYYGNGNHEHRIKLHPEVYGDMAAEYENALAQMGISPLANAHVMLPEYGIVVYGAEIGEEYYQRIRLANMEPGYMSGILGQAPENLFTVLLAHNPDYFPQYAAWGADLTLSGHVHGGVIRIPIWGKGLVSPAWRLFPKYDGGIFREGLKVMVQSRGMGSHTIPVRLFNPAELWIIEFASDRTDR